MNGPNKNLLYSTGNSAQYSVITKWERNLKENKYITESLCCTPETNPTLLINYTPILKKKNKNSLVGGEYHKYKNLLNMVLLYSKCLCSYLLCGFGFICSSGSFTICISVSFILTFSLTIKQCQISRDLNSCSSLSATTT